MHTKAGTGFCLGKSYRRRCRGKVRGRELGKSGTFFGACMILEGKQAINSGAKLRRGKKGDGELVFSLVMRNGWGRKKDLKYLENICDGFGGLLMRLYFEHLTKGSIKYRREQRGGYMIKVRLFRSVNE